MAMNGMPIYAECGGMMYLCRGVKDMQGRRYLMAGVFDAEVELTGRLQAIGYVEAKVIRDCVLSPIGGSARGHVFHYSHVTSTSEDHYAYDLGKKKGIAGEKDGFVLHNTLSSYTHLHFASCPSFAANFVAECVKYGRG